MKKCLVIGSTVCDIIIHVDKLPGSQGDVHISKQFMSLGGCAYNVVSVLHHLDVPYTFISPVGSGVYGDFVRDKLKSKGIKTDISLEGNNGCCYCFVEANGDRTFMSDHGVEYTFNPDWLKDIDVNEYSYAYICGLEIEEVNGMDLIKALKDFKGEIIFCPGPRRNLIEEDRMTEVYKLSPIVHLNDREVKELTHQENVEKAVEVMYGWTRNTVIVTLGEKGALYYDGEIHYIEGYPNKVVDTIGAGDSHTGGVLTGLSNGMNLNEAIDFANKVSSKVVGVSGVELELDEYNSLFANNLRKDRHK